MAFTLKFNSGPTFTFLTMVTPTGIPLSIARVVEEMLATSGVNGRRWRTVNRQHRAFPVRTLAEAADFTAAINLANGYLTALSNSQLATLSDGAVTLANVHVADCDPTCSSGQVVGGASTSSLASVACTWLIEYTYFAAGAA